MVPAVQVALQPPAVESGARWKNASGGTELDSAVYAATGYEERHRQGLYALDNESGDVIWDIDLSGFPITSSPVFYEGKVLLQSGGVASFNAETGELQWRYEVTSGSPIHAPTTIPVIENFLIYCSFDEGPGLLVVDLETGTPIWETNSASFASPVAQNGIVYAGSVEGESPIFDSESDTKFFSYDIRKEMNYGMQKSVNLRPSDQI